MNGVVCMTGVPISDRPRYFAALLSDLLQLRGRYGRPHWLVIDEAHHLLPAEWEIPNGLLPEHLVNVLLVTVHPELLSAEMQKRVTQAHRRRAYGARAAAAIRRAPGRAADGECTGATGASPSRSARSCSGRPTTSPCAACDLEPPSAEQRRHTRKYAVGQLPPDRSFYFRGPEGKLNLTRAEPAAIPRDRGWRRRRHVALPFPARRLLALVPRRHQGS